MSTKYQQREGLRDDFLKTRRRERRGRPEKRKKGVPEGKEGGRKNRRCGYSDSWGGGHLAGYPGALSCKYTSMIEFNI